MELKKSMGMRESKSKAKNAPQLNFPVQKSDINVIYENEEIGEINIIFECPVCISGIENPFEIKEIHPGHKVCTQCLETWIKVKFTSKQWNFKDFLCPITG